MVRFVPGLILLAAMGVNHPAMAAAAVSPQHQSKTQSKAEAQPRAPADAQIERTIRTKLAKSKLREEHFTFTVVKGVATIEGSTTVMQHKGAMTRMAKTSGATSVHNNIRVSAAAKAKAAASLARGRSAASLSRPAAPLSRPVAGGSSGGRLATAVTPVPHATVLAAAASRQPPKP